MQRYVFVGCVERVPSGGYSLFFPDLSGCVTAAEDMVQLASRAREALDLHLEGMAEEGLPIPVATPPELIAVDPDMELAATLLVESIPAGHEQVVLELSASTLRDADAAASASGRTRARVLEDRLEATTV